MNTVSVERIILAAASRAGLDGASLAGLSDSTRKIMLDGFQWHLTMAWEWFDWPDLTRTEERDVVSLPDGERYVPLVATGKTSMGAVFGIYGGNPLVGGARRLEFCLENGNAWLSSDAPLSVWARFRLVPQMLPADEASAMATEIPKCLADAVRFGLVGDLLTEDGQVDKAEIMYQRQEGFLVHEADKVMFQQDQPRRWTARMGAM